MELLEQIKKDRMTARREKDGVKATLLTTLVGEADNILKSKQAKNYSTVALVKKFIKGLEDTANAKGGLSLDESKELAILKLYLPKTYTISELENIIDGQDLSKGMGPVMGYLKKNHGDRVDMKMAQMIIKEKIK
jgi:uncharacterized protein YqeY